MTTPDSGMFMDTDSSCLPCTPDEEKRIVKELTDVAESNLKEGNLYYVLSYRWYMEWQRYIGEDTGDYSFDDESQHSNGANGALFGTAYRPGPIYNSHLVSNGTDTTDTDDLEIHRTVEERRDYVLVSEAVWKKLHDWYKGGPALPRKLISQGVYTKSFHVEVYPLCLQLIDSRDNSQLVIQISKKASVRELYNRVCTLLELDQGKVHIWDYFNKKKHASLTLSDKTLEEVQLQMDQHILLEMQLDGFQPSGWGMDSTGNELALVAIEPSRSSVTIAGGPTMSNGYSTGYVSNTVQGDSLSSTLLDADDGYRPLVTMSKGEGGGLAGLQNLGNTCFMNSAIQCLVHTPPLVEYFLQDYSEEINKQNPLGMHGELAIAFGELLRKLWSGRAPVAPRQFKAKLARFAPQFSGYNQHDSQELLAFLLDGLHEDLNRVKNKPYIEAKDANGRADEEVANECWENHKARNDSVIVDVCQGQYKSTLVCPLCGKVSVTFDPFMYLSLPLPSLATRTMTITVFYGDGSALPMPYTVTVPKHGCYRDLSQALSTACCLKNDESLVLAEVYEHKIYRYLDQPLESLITVKDDDHLVAYRVPKQRDGFTRLEIIHRKSKGKCMSDKPSNGELKFFGTPLVTCLAESPKTGADIQSVVHMMLVPLLRRRSCLPLDQIHTSMKGDSASGVPDDSSSSQPISRNQSMDNMELDQMSNGELPFHLSLTDERCSSCIPIEDVSIIKQGKVIRVLLDWSDRECDLYDGSFLEDLPEVYKSGVTVKKTRQEAISLFSCLEAFLKEEPLGPDDMWYCPTCKEHRQATKKLDLWRLPEILVFHLKRFSYSRYLKNKLDTFVNFPVHDLDLSKYVKSKDSPQSHLYELYAMSNHYGGLGGGHYSANAKLFEGNRWYHFDDNHVSILNEDEIKTSAAYVLFYRRVKVEQDKTVGEPYDDHFSSS